MSSTHSHGKLVAAMKAADGVIYYIGIEKTCESNVYPRTPRWSAVFMGTVEQVVKRIFSMGAACEGGMLQGAGGRDILPENYIAGWLRELANPVMIQGDAEVDIYASSSWSAPVENDHLDSFLKRVDSIDLESAKGLATALRSGEQVTLALHEHFNLVAAIYGCSGSRNPWRVIGDHFCRELLDGVRGAELGRPYSPAKPSKELGGTYMQGQLAGFDMVFEFGDDQVWRHNGSYWCYIERFVRALAEHELSEPGTFRHHIKTLRERLANAPQAPMAQAVCAVNLEAPIPQYALEDVLKAQAQTEHERAGTHVLFNVASLSDDLSYTFSRSLQPQWSYWTFKGAAQEGPRVEQFDLLAS